MPSTSTRLPISVNFRWATVALSALMVLSACASERPGGPGGRGGQGRAGEGAGGRGGEGQFGERGMSGGMTDFNALYRRTMETRQAQGCQPVIPELRLLAQQGYGFDGAQQALGQCLIQMADQKAETGAALTEQIEGLLWLRRAAESGRAEAQGALAAVYLDGPEALRDRPQALFWYALYQDSSRRGRVGFVPLSDRTENRLAAAFTADDVATVAEAVANWQPVIWVPPRERAPDPEARGPRGESDEEESGRRPRRR